MAGKEEKWWKRSYYWLVQGENGVGHLFLLLIRLYWGGMLIVTGFGKWANADATSNFFQSLDIPAPFFMVIFVGAVEFCGGISLVLGFLARLFTIPLIVVFTVAYATAHSESVISFFENPSLFFSQSPFLYLFASVVVLCFGAGMFSFDYWMEKKNYGKPL